MKTFNMFNGNAQQQLEYDKKKITLTKSRHLLASNGVYSRDQQNWYSKVNRFGWLDVYDNDDIIKEFLFFTKPNLYIFEDNGSSISYSSATPENLQKDLANIPYFVHQAAQHKDALCQLQYNVKDRVHSSARTPFMYILTNAVQSKLDLPSITPTDSDSTENQMGVSLKYRGHSLKSDNNYDFSLTFMDTADLEIYTLVKAYDEYMRLLKVGDIPQRDADVINHIIPEMFSIYKFLIRSDGETIAYWAKLTGCYFSDVPRGDMSDPKNEGGFKYSVNFHASFVEDMNPMILSEFNKLVYGLTGDNYTPAPTYNYSIMKVDNRWASFPIIQKVRDTRSTRHSGSMDTSKYNDYRLRFVL